MKKKPKPQKPKVIEGTRLHYNRGVQVAYYRSLEALMNPMFEEVSAAVIRYFKKPLAKEFYAKQEKASAMDASVASQAKILTDKLYKKFEGLFAERAKPTAEKMVRNSGKVSAVTLKTSLKKLSGGITLKTDVLTGPLKEVLKASVNENVDLIKSIADNYLSNVSKQVMRSITTGNGLADLIPALEKYKGITKRHARNVALDQTRKVYNSLNRGRMEARGIKQFKWLHSGGGMEPREDHIAMSGKIFSFDNLPVIDKKTGERGIPGQAINCKCTMTPVIDLTDDDK